MTQQEILNLPHLKIAEVKTDMFVHVHTEDDYRITSWNEGDPIENYSGTVCMWMPIRDNYDGNYRVITIEEHNVLDAQHQEFIQKQLEERNNRRMTDE